MPAESMHCRTMPRLRGLIADLSTWRPGSDPMAIYVGFVVYTVALWTGFAPSILVYPLKIILPKIRIQ